MNVIVDETPSIPPGPRGYWVLGNLPDFAGDLLGFLTRCARDYGDIVRLRLGTSPAVLLNHPNQIEQVLVTRQAEFVKYRFFWRHVTRVFGNGLLTSSGSLWQRQHALMAPAFRQERLALSVDKMVCCANRLFDHWQDGEERDIRADMTRLTLEIAAKVLFDVELDHEVAGISRAVDRGMEEVSKRFKRGMFIPDWIPTPGNRRYLATVRDLDAAAANILAERRAPCRNRTDLALDVIAKSGCRGASNGRPAAS
jgi:cytochrome P450